MNRKQIYARVKEFSSGRMGSMVFGLIIISLIYTAVANIFVDIDNLMIDLFLSVFSSLMFSGYTIEVYKTYKEDRGFKVFAFLSHIFENISSLTLISLIVALISLAAGFVIGLVIVIVPGLALVMGILTIVVTLFVNLFSTIAFIAVADNKADDGISALTYAKGISKGYLSDYFMIIMKYTWPVMLAFLAVIISFIPLFVTIFSNIEFIDYMTPDQLFSLIDLNNVLIILLLFIVFGVLAIYYGVKVYCASAIFYTEISGANDDSVEVTELNVDIVEIIDVEEVSDQTE